MVPSNSQLKVICAPEEHRNAYNDFCSILVSASLARSRGEMTPEKYANILHQEEQKYNLIVYGKAREILNTGGTPQKSTI
jgi:hypothetical protein